MQMSPPVRQCRQNGIGRDRMPGYEGRSGPTTARWDRAARRKADDLVAAEAGFHHYRDQLRTMRVECQDPIRHD
jgi:hypothetical protein